MLRLPRSYLKNVCVGTYSVPRVILTGRESMWTLPKSNGKCWRL